MTGCSEGLWVGWSEVRVGQAMLPIVVTYTRQLGGTDWVNMQEWLKMSNTGWVLVAHSCNPDRRQRTIRRKEVWSQCRQIVHKTLSWKTQHRIEKNKKKKKRENKTKQNKKGKNPTQNRAGGVAQVVMSLPSKYDALSSSSTMTKPNQTKQTQKQQQKTPNKQKNLAEKCFKLKNPTALGCGLVQVYFQSLIFYLVHNKVLFLNLSCLIQFNS
jgi:hypothetical protein